MSFNIAVVYTDRLLLEHKDVWAKATEHILTDELSAGSLDLRKLYVYLSQDFKFFEYGLRIVGRAISLCDDYPAANRLAKQAGFFANDENDYFVNVIKELKEKLVSDSLFTSDRIQEIDAMLFPDVAAYINFLKSFGTEPSITYPKVITMMWVMEQVYQDWATRGVKNFQPENLHWWYKGWIDLHYGEDFSSWTQFLKDEVDKCYIKAFKENDTKTVEDIKSTFLKTADFEGKFFDETYHYV
ncbi:BA75_05073T0 [Komagataella pastoris]|uniref:BA75_05073T0 n=1 Tax=Komagataella pastoris TaxID=4922 RepID=A0A1B2JIB0_PICPA|nr:BA75_05073T0 [Komagataella pastoris]